MEDGDCVADTGRSCCLLCDVSWPPPPFWSGVAVDYGARDVSRTAQERLRLISATLSTSIERFRYLPDVVARSREIEDLFRQSATPEQGLAPTCF